MAHLNVGEENSMSIDLHYQDFGNGQPVVLIHGWPLSSKAWEKQIPSLLSHGYRVITYDRRGFGESGKPSVGYDYDTLARDLHFLMNHLNLRNAVLIGHSMGTGEVARYLATYGQERVSKAVFISSILPSLLKTPDNSEGIDPEVFEKMKRGIADDRLAFLSGFFKDFYGHSVLGGSGVSDEVQRYSWMIAAQASPLATFKCISSWQDDFTADIKKITVPSLVIHGDADHILPIKATGRRLREALPGCEYLEVRGGSHGLPLSHSEEVNSVLADFIANRNSIRTAVQVGLRH